MHAMIAGVTGAGKTRFAREHLCPTWSRKGYATIVLDVTRQKWKGVTYQTHDVAAFTAALKQSRRCIAFVDEPSQVINRDTEADVAWTAQVSRNFGHLVYFLCQSPYQLPPRIRGAISWGYLFRLQRADAECCNVHFNLDAHGIDYVPTLRRLELGHCILTKPTLRPRLIQAFNDIRES